MSGSRNVFKSALAIMMTLLVTLLMLAIPRDVDALGINKQRVTLTKGQTTQLTITGAGDFTVTWSTSNRNVATVSKSGKVTAKGTGKCTISGKVGDQRLSCTVTVTNKKSTTKTRSISASDTSVSVKAGSSTTVTITARGDHNVRVQSSDKSIATASWTTTYFTNDKIKLRIKGVRNGTATIRVKMTNATSYYVDIRVRVTGGTTTTASPTISRSSVTVNVGQSDSFTVSSGSGSDTSVYLSDDSIATVTKGVWSNNKCTITVKGKNAGTAYLYVQNNKTGATKSIPVYVKGSSLTTSVNTVNVNAGSTNSFTVYTSNPRGISVYTANSNVATCYIKQYNTGSAVIMVEGQSAGNTSITINENSSGASTRVNVVVTGRNLTVSPTSLTLGGNSSRGSFTVYCDNGAYLTATSSNPSVAEVSAGSVGSGSATYYVYGYKSGSATITVRDSYSNKSVTVYVTVKGGGNLSVSPSSLNINMNSTNRTTFSVYCDNPNYLNVYANNPSICDVSQGSWNGNYVTYYVYPNRTGSTTIMVKDTYSGQSTSVSVYITGSGYDDGQVGMSVSRGTVEIGRGGSGSFTVTCNSPYNLSVNSGNYSVASVNATVTGSHSVTVYVYAVGSGTTMITLHDPTTNETRNVTVIVNGYSNGDIVYDPNSYWW